MKALKNCIKLGCSVKIYVPSTSNVNETADTSRWVDASMKLLAQEFGGATATQALGAWLSMEKGLVKERVTLVIAYTTSEGISQKIDLIYEFCEKMKKDLSQETIALEINNELYFI